MSHVDEVLAKLRNERIQEAVALAGLLDSRQLLGVAEFLEYDARFMAEQPQAMPRISVASAAVATLCRVLASETRCDGTCDPFCNDCCPF